MKKLFLYIFLVLMICNVGFAEIDKIKNLDTIKFILSKDSISPSGIEMGSYLCWGNDNKSNYSVKKMSNRTCHRTFSHKLFKTLNEDGFKKLYEEFVSATNIPKCKGQYSKDPTKNDSLNWDNCIGYIHDQGDTFIAPFREGYITGLGIKIDYAYSIYIGEFVDDYMHGKGIYYSSGDFFKDFPIRERKSIVEEGIWYEDEQVETTSRKNFR